MKVFHDFSWKVSRIIECTKVLQRFQIRVPCQHEVVLTCVLLLFPHVLRAAVSIVVQILQEVAYFTISSVRMRHNNEELLWELEIVFYVWPLLHITLFSHCNCCRTLKTTKTITSKKKKRKRKRWLSPLKYCRYVLILGVEFWYRSNGLHLGPDFLHVQDEYHYIQVLGSFEHTDFTFFRKVAKSVLPGIW